MPFVPTPNTYQLAIRWRYAGQRCENVLAVQTIPAGESGDIGAMAANVWGKVVRDILPTVAPDCQLSSIYVKGLWSDTAPSTEYAATGTFPGTASGSALPNNVALAIHKQTAIGGRSGAGRLFHPGITTAMLLDPNTITDTAAVDILTAWDSLLTEMVTDPDIPLQIGVLSTFHAGAPRTAGVFVPMTLFTLRDHTLDSQRRRLPGRGR